MPTKLGGLTDTVEILGRDSAPTVLDLDGIEATIFESNVWTKNLVRVSRISVGKTHQ